VILKQREVCKITLVVTCQTGVIEAKNTAHLERHIYHGSNDWDPSSEDVDCNIDELEKGNQRLNTHKLLPLTIYAKQSFGISNRMHRSTT
jgi:hypothetical protein